MIITKEGFAVVERDTHFRRWVEESGRLDHDQNLNPRLKPYLKQGDHVFDVGANIGTMAAFFSKAVGPEGWVFCFEPNEEAHSCLVFNSKQMGNVTAIRWALSNKECLVDVVCENDNVGMAYVKEGKTIPCYTIDGMRFEKIDFLKLDCEGKELAVLEGAKRTLQVFKPTLLIEINEATMRREGYGREAIYSLLEDYGYAYENIYPKQGLDELQMDVICVHKSKK